MCAHLPCACIHAHAGGRESRRNFPTPPLHETPRREQVLARGAGALPAVLAIVTDAGSSSKEQVRPGALFAVGKPAKRMVPLPLQCMPAQPAIRLDPSLPAARPRSDCRLDPKPSIWIAGLTINPKPKPQTWAPPSGQLHHQGGRLDDDGLLGRPLPARPRQASGRKAAWLLTLHWGTLVKRLPMRQVEPLRELRVKPHHAPGRRSNLQSNRKHPAEPPVQPPVNRRSNPQVVPRRA